MDNICNNNNLNRDIFSFPFFINSLYLLNNFQSIIYNGCSFPRIPLNSSDFKSINHFFYDSLEDIDNNETKKEKDINEGEIEIILSDYDDKIINNDIKFIDNEKNNISKINTSFNKFKKKEPININNNFNYKNNLIIKNAENFEPEPPINIIKSIIEEKIYENKINLKDINYTNINNIIKNNINLLLSNYNNIKNNEAPFSPKIINKYNNIQMYNYFNVLQNICPNNEINNCKVQFEECPKIIPSFKLITEKMLRNKRGRERRLGNKKGRIHTAGDEDNLLRKIQVHFLSFIINFVNDVIKTFVKDKNPPLFKNLDYKIKKSIKRSFFNDLKTKKISEILQLKVTPKVKDDANANKRIYSSLCSSYPFMSNFLEENYLSLFKEYYYNKNKNFIVNGNTIQISSKTKNFNDLLMKNNVYKNKLKNVALKNYINCSKDKQNDKGKSHIFDIIYL